MDRDKLIELIRQSGYGYFITHENANVEECLANTADHIIANGIGDIIAENINHSEADAKAKEALELFECHCHDAISEVYKEYIDAIAVEVDNKIGSYKKRAEDCKKQLCENEQLLTAETHRADVAEEALRNGAVGEDLYCSSDDERERLYLHLIREAEERLKERV